MFTRGLRKSSGKTFEDLLHELLQVGYFFDVKPTTSKNWRKNCTKQKHLTQQPFYS